MPATPEESESAGPSRPTKRRIPEDYIEEEDKEMRKRKEKKIKKRSVDESKESKEKKRVKGKGKVKSKAIITDDVDEEQQYDMPTKVAAKLPSVSKSSGKAKQIQVEEEKVVEKSTVPKTVDGMQQAEFKVSIPS